MILLLDNYDSFTFNLYQSLAVLGAEVHVVRNDALTVEAALELEPAAVVLSPGPGRPENAGILLALIAALPARTPLLGVCLGHQAIVLSEGGRLEIDAAPVHGKASPVEHDGSGLFEGLAAPMICGRYHSLRADPAHFPASLCVTARTADGHIMALAHAALPRYGVQFHPESILTPDGDTLLANFVRLANVPLGATLPHRSGVA